MSAQSASGQAHQALPTRLGEGTLVQRVDVLEDAVDLLLRAQVRCCRVWRGFLPSLVVFLWTSCSGHGCGAAECEGGSRLLGLFCQWTYCSGLA